MAANNDHEFSKRVIQNIVDIFIAPEVKRRQDVGEFPKPIQLKFAQVILFPDERKPRVRINEEVRAKAKVKYKPRVCKEPGAPIYENEIEAIDHVELGPDDDPDCGHIFLYFHGNSAFLWFDFRRNRALARNHIQRAKDYFKTASHCMQSGSLAPFIDNLFNAAELSVKAVLLVMYDYTPSLRAKSGHRGIQIRYNQFANLGNVMPEYKEIFNKLAGLHNPARYLKGDLPNNTDVEDQRMLDVVSAMIQDAERRVG